MGVSYQNLNRKVFLILSLFSFCSAAQAASGIKRVFIEPDLGYSTLASLKTASMTDEQKLQGLSLGGRLGFRIGSVLLLGGSAKYMPSLEYPGVTGKPKLLTAGAFLGLASPMTSLRIWGGYNILDQITFENQVKYIGRSFFAGLSLRLLGPITLNAELVLPAYNKIEANLIRISMNELKGRYAVFSVSFPLYF